MYISRCRYPEDTASQDTGGYPEDTGYPQDTGLYPEDTPMSQDATMRFQMIASGVMWEVGGFHYSTVLRGFVLQWGTISNHRLR